MYRNVFSLTLPFLLIFITNSFAQHTSIPTMQDTTVADTALANTYFYRAEVLAGQGQYDSLAFYFKNARAIYKAVAEKTNDRKLWANYIFCLNRMVLHFSESLGKLKAAYDYVHEALEVGPAKLGENHPVIGYTYFLMAIGYDLQGDSDATLEYYHKALRIWQSAYGEEHPHIGKIHNNMSIVYAAIDDTSNANKYRQKSNEAFGTGAGEERFTSVSWLLNQAKIYAQKGDHGTADEYSRRAIPLIEKLIENIEVRKRQGVEQYNKVGLLKWILTTAESPGVNKEYLNYEYFDWLKRMILHADARSIAPRYTKLGRIYLQMKDFDRARAYFTRALELERSFWGEKSEAVAVSYRRIGDSYAAEADFRTAAKYYQKSIVSLVQAFDDTSTHANPEIAGRIESEVELMYSLQRKSESLAQLYSLQTQKIQDLKASYACYRKASELVDFMRKSYRTEGSKINVGVQAANIYAGAIQTCLLLYEKISDPQYKHEAFRFSEKSKASVLLENLKELQARTYTNIPQELLSDADRIRKEITATEGDMSWQIEKGADPDALSINTLRDRLFSLRRRHEQLIRQFEAFYPKYYDLKYGTATVEVSALQQKLDDHTAIISYSMGDSAIYTFAITGKNFHVAATKIDANFKSQLNTLAQSFKNVTSRPVYLKYACTLYKHLVEPIEPYVAGMHHWTIIPDGELHQIPFEALLTEEVTSNADLAYSDLPYLVKNHEISYHYSATLLDRSRREKEQQAYAYDFAGFAPVFSKSINNGRLLSPESPPISFISVPQDKTSYLRTSDGENLDELPNSEHEVRKILSLFKSASRKGHIFLHRQASEAAFKETLGDYKYVHIATHGFIQNEFPRLSNLAFSQSQSKNAKEDGILYSGETYNLDLNADLLVLSSCDSGAGKLVRGEGVMALTRGFLYSGARNIIASLWKVYDQHTSLLMIELYKNILADKSYSEALRAAKLKMISDEATAAPQSWASFVLIGR